MEIEIIKSNDVIQLQKDGKNIESYDLTKSIDFHDLMSFLISDELNNKIELINKNNDLNDQETSLCTLIEQIIKDYNSKIDDFNNFLKEDNL